MKTTKQKILEFIVSYIKEHSYPPTVREIGEGVGLKKHIIRTESYRAHVRLWNTRNGCRAWKY